MSGGEIPHSIKSINIMAFPALIKTGLQTLGTDMYANGMNALGNFVNGFVSEFFADRARKKNYEYNEKAANEADKRQRAQYQDLYSPEAQMAQYAAAGLSPSMMMSGGQSAVGGTPQGPIGGLSGPMPSASGGQSLMGANIANINADTKLKEAQATNMGADTEFTMANITKVAEETNNLRMQNGLIKLQRDKLQLDIDLQKETNAESIKQAVEKTEQMYLTSENLRKQNTSLGIKNEVDAATMETRIKQAAEEYNTQLAETALKWANVELSQEKVTSLIATVATNNANATTQRLNVELQRRQINEQVTQWAKQNGFTEKELKQENTKNWLNFATNIFGSVCNLAGTVGAAALKAK